MLRNLGENVSEFVRDVAFQTSRELRRRLVRHLSHSAVLQMPKWPITFRPFVRITVQIVAIRANSRESVKYAERETSCGNIIGR